MDAGIQTMQAWSAEDERVCEICGGRHGELIEDGWFPPYHPLCRCAVIPKMPELSEDIDILYEEMFGDLLDEFANDQFGIKLTHLKTNDAIKDKMRDIDMSTASKDDIIELGKLINDEHDIASKLGNKDEIKQILGQYRSFGGKIEASEWAKGSRKEAKERINNAFSYYPTEWANLIKNNRKKLFAGLNQRGFFSSAWRTAEGRRKSVSLEELLNTATIYLSGSSATVEFHEIGHLVENYHPDTLRISKEFIADRTKGEQTKKLSSIFPGFGYRDDEITKPDDFISPYIGKEYDDASEVLSMGLESIYEPENGQLTKIENNELHYRDIRSDPEYLNLIIGLLIKG